MNSLKEHSLKHEKAEARTIVEAWLKAGFSFLHTLTPGQIHMGLLVESQLQVSNQKTKIFIFNHVYVCMCVGYAYMSAGYSGSHEMMSDSLELELQKVMSHYVGTGN